MPKTNKQNKTKQPNANEKTKKRFYLTFHVSLNITAELLRFADREFYRAWWNAPDLAAYWRLWNMPVHKWCLRTVYFPVLRHGWSAYWAGAMLGFACSLCF